MACLRIDAADTIGHAVTPPPDVTFMVVVGALGSICWVHAQQLWIRSDEFPSLNKRPSFRVSFAAFCLKEREKRAYSFSRKCESR